jgi:O-antigen ligase
MNRWLELSQSNPRSYALRVGVTVAVVAVVLGAALGFAGPLITVGALLALAVSLWALSRLEVGLYAVIAVITLLPFGSLPVRVVFRPTFLDVAMLGVLLVYALQWMSGQRRRLTLVPAQAPVALFMMLAVFSFVLGLSNGPLTPNLIRQFAEMLLSIAFVFIVVDVVAEATALERLARVIMLTGALAALVGIMLYVLPEALTNRALSTLSVFEYPAGDVVRYIEDNPDNPQRAISTSIDPNALGGMLAMVGGLIAPQLVAKKSILWSRGLTFIVFGLVVTCLVLTFSRGALAALAAAMSVITLARYRRLLVVLALGASLILFLPVTQEYVAHFVEGVQGQDLATQMRFGEYKDAFTLISRYPWLGVGFSGAPVIDLYVGVSSAYLLLLSEMGLLGMAGFLLVIGAMVGWGFLRRKTVYADVRITPIWLGVYAGLAAALTVGFVDHYFFNLNFQAAGTLFWLYVGLAFAATRLSDQAEASNVLRET